MLRGVLGTTLGVFGIICNSISIAIFCKSKMKSSFNLTLIGKVFITMIIRTTLQVFNGIYGVPIGFFCNIYGKGL